MTNKVVSRPPTARRKSYAVAKCEPSNALDQTIGEFSIMVIEDNKHSMVNVEVVDDEKTGVIQWVGLPKEIKHRMTLFSKD